MHVRSNTGSVAATRVGRFHAALRPPVAGTRFVVEACVARRFCVVVARHGGGAGPLVLCYVVLCDVEGALHVAMNS